MDLPICEEVAKFRDYYGKEIKLLIEKGEYQIASVELGNQLFFLNERKKDLVLNVHKGLSYLSYMTLLVTKLETANSKKDLDDILEKFEASQAQTKLPLIR